MPVFLWKRTALPIPFPRALFFMSPNRDLPSLFGRVNKSFGTYHTSRQMAGFLLELYDSEKVVGLVDRENFCFRLADPQFPYAGNSSHNQQRM